MKPKRKPRRLWISYVRAILLNYPHVTDREREAVDLAITATCHEANGAVVRAIIEMVFVRKSHTLDGAAQQVHYSYSAAGAGMGPVTCIAKKSRPIPTTPAEK